NGMKLAETLEDWQNTEWAAQKIRSLYEKDETYKDRILRFVLPSLGHALLHQPNRLQEAYDILVQAEKAMESNKTNSYYEVFRLVCMALGGWPSFDESGLNYQENRGLGRPVEAIDRYSSQAYKNY